MLVKLVIGENIFEPDEWKGFETNDVCAELQKYFGKWPANARLYHNEVSQETDITPTNLQEIETLQSLQGIIYCVVYPSDPISVVIAVVAVAASAALSFLFSPAVPNVASTANNQVQSSNNELSNRVNKARPNGRISDIYGTVRAIPDLIADPYKTFENNIEIEHAFFCLGRGQYRITNIRDDTTLFSTIAGTSLAVYGPNTSPNFGTPQSTIGKYKSEGILATRRYTSVNGQTIQGPNYKTIKSNPNFQFGKQGDYATSKRAYIVINNSENRPFDFSEAFSTGDQIVLVDSGSLSGTYILEAVDTDRFIILEPELTNNNWNGIGAGQETGIRTARIDNVDGNVLGYFEAEDKYATSVMLNFVASNGLYQINDQGEYSKRDIQLLITVLCDANNTEYNYNYTMLSSTADRTQRAQTFTIDLPVQGSFRIKVRRITELAIGETGTFAEEVKWRDLYSAYKVTSAHFGNVTTIYAKTKATTGALAVKDRKLNMLATRLVPNRDTGTLYPSNKFEEILQAVCRDPYIGNRSLAELNLINFNTVANDIRSYFGTDLAAEFCYTFDKSDMSFEDTVSTIVNAVFCTAYRRGNIINISFERQNDMPTLLFNHRNKLPGTETRSVRFGNQDNNDGVKLKYIDPEDEAEVTITLPTNYEPINPKEVETIGIRNYEQAYFQANRTWNKIRYQNVSTEFDATQVADILVIKDLILVADNTRAGVIGGEVETQTGLTLELDRDVPYEKGMSVMLQHSDGLTEAIELVGNGSSFREVVLAKAPRKALALLTDTAQRAIYNIVRSSDDRTVMPFIVAEKAYAGKAITSLTVINYDTRYYGNDKDKIKGLI